MQKLNDMQVVQPYVSMIRPNNKAVVSLKLTELKVYT
jgi:hypothetical protein